MKITEQAIKAMPKLERVQLATSLPGAKPICLVGTCSHDGVTNLAPFSSVTHLGSNPVLIGMVTRPATVERHTLSNIMATNSWTLNLVHSGILEQAHQCSARYDISEFEATGLTPYFEPGISAPFVEQSRVRYALELREIIDIASNDTKLIVGEVIFIEVEEGMIQSDGGIALVQADTIASTALDTYFKLLEHKQLDYAKP